MDVGLGLPAQTEAESQVGADAPVVLVEQACLDLSDLRPGIARRDGELGRHTAERANLRRRIAEALEKQRASVLLERSQLQATGRSGDTLVAASDRVVGRVERRTEGAGK